MTVCVMSINCFKNNSHLKNHDLENDCHSQKDLD